MHPFESTVELAARPFAEHVAVHVVMFVTQLRARINDAIDIRAGQ